jgi:hypothetical protein
MHISPFTLQRLAKMVSGDTKPWPYRSGPVLIRFFNSLGFSGEYGQGFPTRYIYAENKLTELNGTPRLANLFSNLLDMRHWLNDLTGLVEYADHDACIDMLNNILTFDNLKAVKQGVSYKVVPINSLVMVDAPIQVDSESGIEEQIEKCRQKIQGGDYEGAITNARSLVETLLTSIEKELDPKAPDPDGDLVKTYNRVRTLLNLDPSRKDISDALKQVLTGLSSIIHGLATMRNKMSDAHATSYKPARHHAKLAVNAAKTVCDFLFETMAYQREKGTLKASSH